MRVQTCLSPVTRLTPPVDGVQRCARCGWEIRPIAGTREYAHVTTTEQRRAEADRRLRDENAGITREWHEDH